MKMCRILILICIFYIQAIVFEVAQNILVQLYILYTFRNSCEFSCKKISKTENETHGSFFFFTWKDVFEIIF